VLRRLGVIVTMIMLSGCSHGSAQESGRHEVHVVVVYSDRDTINAEARKRGYRSQANGFYDPVRNELWCPKEESADAFRTCGHELRRAVRGEAHR
jgi:hypothetical protein